MPDPVADPVRAASRVGVFLGILTIVLGLIAIAAPAASGVVATAIIGVVLVAAGIAQMFFAFKAESFAEGFLAVLFGLFAVVAGVFMFARPVIGLAALTLVVTFYFFVDGIFGIFMSFSVKPEKGWVSLLIGSIASVLLGLLIISEWPASGVWAMGILIGVRLIFMGWSMIALGAVGEVAADEIERESQ